MTVNLQLTQGKTTIVDNEDYDKIKEMKWHAVNESGKFYVCHNERNGRKIKMIFLHRFLLGLKSGEQCDHINGDGLDNRRINLRVVTNAQNQMNCFKPRIRGENRSCFKGVVWHKQTGKWQAQIGNTTKKHYRLNYLGLFSSEVEAAKQLFGEYARLNFPELLGAVDPNHVRNL